MHPSNPSYPRPSRILRGYDYQWLKLSATMIAEEPYCHRCLSTTDLTLDHIIPASRGGLGIRENAVVLCRRCNSSKRDRVRA